MSVENEILRIQHNIANTYAAVSRKGGEVPLQPTSANLPAAVESIPQGPTYTAGDGIDITETEAGASIGVTTPVRNVLTQAEYDALPEAERNKGLYVISDGGSGGGGSSGEVYSTDETRIGTWIDGKPLYRRTYEFTVATTANKRSSTVFVRDAAITPVGVHGFGDVDFPNGGNGRFFMPSSMTGGTSTTLFYGYYYDRLTKELSCLIFTDITATFRCTAVVEYTKTTDEGGTA